MKRLLFLVPALILVYLALPAGWSGGPISLAAFDEEGNVIHIVNFDTEAGTVTDVAVPGNTQVEVANNLGTWPLSAAWELGKKEGYGGRLLADTITRSLKFPVGGWGEGEIISLSEGGLSAITAVFASPGSSTIRAKDRLRLAIFSVSAPLRRINLEETGYLKEGTITGGDRGYVIRAKMPLSLASVFAQKKVVEEGTKIKIINESGSASAQYVAGTASVLGAQVASVLDGPPADYDCRIEASEDSATAKALSEVFGCARASSRDLPDQVLFYLGKGFSGRF